MTRRKTLRYAEEIKISRVSKKPGLGFFIVFLSVFLISSDNSLLVSALSPRSSLNLTGQGIESSDDLDFSSMPAPFDFSPLADNLNLGVEGKRSMSSDWLDRRLMVHFILEILSEKEMDQPLSQTRVLKAAKEMAAEWGRKRMTEDELRLVVSSHLYELTSLGILKQDDQNEYLLAKDPHLVATWADDVEFILRDLKKAVQEGREEILFKLRRYSRASQLQPLYPVEMNYPLLLAAALLARDEREVILRTIRTLRDGKTGVDPLWREPLINSILLTFGGKRAMGRNWIKTQTPNLAGTRVYELTPEFSQLGGGLGRVTQFHSKAAVRLSQRQLEIKVVEPNYPRLSEPDLPFHLRTDSIPVKLDDLESLDPKLNLPFEMEFMGTRYYLQVVTGTNGNGVPVVQLRDVPDPKTGSQPRSYPMIGGLYVYDGSSQQAPSNLEFAAFFSKACWRWILNRERKLRKEQGDHWRPPIINTNDYQTELLSLWRLIDYYEALERGDKEEAQFLESFFISVTTHTYLHRGFLGRYNESVREQLKRVGIPEQFHWLFISVAKEGEVIGAGEADITLGCARAANAYKAVAAIHAFEEKRHDPSLPPSGVTNGVDRELTTKYLRAYLSDAFGVRRDEIMGQIRNPLQLTELIDEINQGPRAVSIEEYDRIAETDPERIARAKRIAKEVLQALYPYYRLNPDQIFISYSGRLVDEKWGKRAFGSRNIEALLEQGAAVLIFGNVQPNGASQELGSHFLQMMDEMNKNGYPGRFAFNPRFSLEEQLMLLAATDIQVQDSDRGTEAAGYTESAASACGALSMGPPYHEGIIQKHGIPLRHGKVGWGNLLIPVDPRAESYLEALLRILRMDRSDLIAYQANSIRLSRVLDALNTAAANLRFFSQGYERHQRTLHQKRRTLPEPLSLIKGSAIPGIRSVTFYRQEGGLVRLDELNHGSKLVPPGTRLKLRVMVETAGREGGQVAVMLHSPDGNDYFFHPVPNQREWDVHRKPVTPFEINFPHSLIGNYRISLFSGSSRQDWPHVIIYGNGDPIEYSVEPDSGEGQIVRIQLPRYFGGYPDQPPIFKCGFHTGGKEGEPWKYVPQEGAVLYREEGQWAGIQHIEEGVFRIPMTFLPDGERYEVVLRISDPAISMITFVTGERTSDGGIIWHNNLLTNRQIALDTPSFTPPPVEALSSSDYFPADEGALLASL